MGKRRPHSNTARSLFVLAVAGIRARFILEEEPIDVAAPDNPINEPVPDIVVLNRVMGVCMSIRYARGRAASQPRCPAASILR
jgi:hypothetical protein